MNLIAQMMTKKPKALCLYNYEGKTLPEEKSTQALVDYSS
jgi:hypothetical protein